MGGDLGELDEFVVCLVRVEGGGDAGRGGCVVVEDFLCLFEGNGLGELGMLELVHGQGRGEDLAGGDFLGQGGDGGDNRQRGGEECRAHDGVGVCRRGAGYIKVYAALGGGCLDTTGPEVQREREGERLQIIQMKTGVGGPPKARVNWV